MFAGCVDRYVSRGHIDSNSGWDAYSGGGRGGMSKASTALVNDSNESIELWIEPCNSLDSFLKNDTFVITVSIYTFYKDDRTISYYPNNSSISIGEQIIYPTKVATTGQNTHYNNCINNQWNTPTDVVIEGKGKSNEATDIFPYMSNFSLLFQIKPPFVQDSFAFDLGSITIDGNEIDIPTMKFEKGITFKGFLM